MLNFLIAIPAGVQTNITHISPQGDGKKYAERNDNTIAIIAIPNIVQKNLDFHHLIQVAIYILKNNFFKKQKSQRYLGLLCRNYRQLHSVSREIPYYRTLLFCAGTFKPPTLYKAIFTTS